MKRVLVFLFDWLSFMIIPIIIILFLFSSSQPTNMSSYEIEGYNAFVEEQPINSNPYNNSIKEANLWFKGWRKAKRDNQ